jgi:glycosyltransferase involved in cell wall biosynthesis
MKVTLVRARAIVPSVNKVAKALSENGYDVQLLVWDRQNTLSAKDGDGYTVCRFNLKAPYDKLTVFFYLPIWWIYEFFFLLKDKCDVIHACDLDTLIPAIAIKLLKRVRLCYTIYDFYANNLPDGRFQLARKLIRSLVARIEKLGIGFTEILFLVDESRYEDVRGARVSKLVYIYNSPPDYFEEKREHECREITEIAIFHAGVISRSRGLESMIKAIEDLDNITLTIAGIGPDKDLLEAQIAHARNKIQFIEWVPYDEVIKRTLEADILFAFYDPKFAPSKSKWASSNKLFEAMMCGKPIIMSDGSSMADIVRKENCGLVVPYGEVEAIKEAILKLKNDWQLRQTLGQNGRRAYENRYNWQIMKQRLLDSYSAFMMRKSDVVGTEHKEKQRNIGVITVPISQAGLIPLRNLVDILRSLSNEVHLVSGDAGYSFFAQQGGIYAHEVKHKATKAPLTRILNYTWTQTRISWKVMRLRRNVDLWVFFIGGEGLALPVITAKLLRKGIVIASAGSGVKVAQVQRDPFTAAVSFLRSITYSLSNRIILYSPNLIKEWNLEKYRHKISIAPKNFLDFDKFKVQKPLNKRDNLVGYIGRLNSEKGILNFLEAIPKVVATRDKVSFLIGGAGQFQLQVEEYTNKLSKKVKFVGWIPHDDLPHYLNELKLLVLPSYTEGLPNIMLEAMACDTPVLATPVGAIPDVIRSGETGFIMEGNSTECIAKNIVRALNHPNLEQIAGDARALVEREFTFEKAVDRYREILKEFSV